MSSHEIELTVVSEQITDDIVFIQETEKVPYELLKLGFPFAFFLVIPSRLKTELAISDEFFPTAVDLLTEDLVDDTNQDYKSFLNRVDGLSLQKRLSLSVLVLNIGGISSLQQALSRFSGAEESLPGKAFHRSVAPKWIRMGLDCVDDNSLDFVGSPPPKVFKECHFLEVPVVPAFGSRWPNTTTRPRMWAGGSFEEAGVASALNKWTNHVWYQTIDEAYVLGGIELAQSWVAMVPGAGINDPVYRFLNMPTVNSRREAMRFVRMWLENRQESVAHSKGKIQTAGENLPSISVLLSRPPQFQHGPVRCSKAALNRAIAIKPRANCVDRRLYSDKNPSGVIWCVKFSDRKNEYWFLHERDYLTARNASDDKQ